MSVAQPQVGEAELPPASHDEMALLPPTIMTASYGLLLKDLTYVRGYVAYTGLFVMVTLMDCARSRHVQPASVA